MNIVQLSIRQPVTTFAVVILIIVFGFVGLKQLPVQLTPDIEAPKVNIRTAWAGASPYEIEKEIIEEQEDVLKSLNNLVKIESSSYNNYGSVKLEFKVGTVLNNAVMLVNNKLSEVTSYPENADNPVITTASETSSPVIWLMLKIREGNPEKIKTYGTFYENEIRHELERIPGVASLFFSGGNDTRLEITVDTEKLAQQRLSFSKVINRIQTANSDISAGVLGLQNKNYRIRTVSQFQSPADTGKVVIDDDGMHRILLRDIAASGFGYAKDASTVIHNGDPVIAVGVRKEAGANVLELTDRVRQTIEELNNGILKENGVYFDWVYDQTPYINNAIDTVQFNLLIGGLLAVGALFLFLRSIASTLTVAIAIPISVMGTFFAMYIADRNINVVSLAGITFAVGMLVDNSIVVLENIDRHRRLGKTPFQAAYDGTTEVWGAILASTLTTVAVFLPILFIEEEAGQLFRDIAIAITASISISLFVSISVIPTVMKKFYGFSKKPIQKNVATLDNGNLFVRTIMKLSSITLYNGFTRFITVIFFVCTSLLIITILTPKAEYLPQGNRNLILNIMVPPPGYSEDKRRELGYYIMDQLSPFQNEDGKDGVPQIKNLFYVASDALSLFGGTSIHITEARKMMPLFTQVMNSIPGMFGISIQGGIFQSGLGRSRTVDVNVTGSDYEQIVAAAGILFGMIRGELPEAQVRPVPSLEVTYPEANLIPDREATLANGLNERELGIIVDVLMDGRKIGEYKADGGKIMDLILKSGEDKSTSPEDILQMPITNGYGELVTVGDMASLQYEQGMTQIAHLERKRNIRLEVTPPDDLPLESAMELISEKLVPQLQSEDKLPGVKVAIGGNADKLTLTREALQWNFLMAIFITYLLMASLFGNYLYPFLILLTIPLAAAGGFIGLLLANKLVAPQPFDILVMLGFIILVGTVVNNAILIVHQTLNNIRNEGMIGADAIRHSVRTRIRPIFMSTTTSLFGLLPLVIAQGSGTELYRGLGSVILGGLALSTILTLFVIPALLALCIHFEKAGPEPQSSH